MTRSLDRYAPIALLDSGAGGIGVLQEVQKLLPQEQLLYFGDTANAPYGERSDAEVLKLVLRAAEGLIPRAKALVLACNTATAVAADVLRHRHPDYPIIGMEPALRAALRAVPQAGRAPQIAVLATAATLRSERFRNLCQMYAKNATVWQIPAPCLVRLVERGLGNSSETEAYLRTLFDPLPARPDAVVLGCTHFPFARASISRVLGDIPLLDGAAGTARELTRRLQAAGLTAPDGAGGVLLTAGDPASLPLLARLFC